MAIDDNTSYELTGAQVKDLASKINAKEDSADLAAVAESGDYDDLLNKPTIPAAQVNSDWDAASGVAQILNKPSLAAVATSGAYSDLTGTPSLATVATSGDYGDLLNKPIIPAAQVNSDWDAASGVAQILNKPSLATVATSGSYTDLSNKPTIPTVNDATLTIQKNGTAVETFTANSSSNKTANITTDYNKTADNLTPTADTPAAWKTAVGATDGAYLTRYTTAGKFTNQPTAHGFLETFLSNQDIYQRWHSQSSGRIQYRSGNATGWNGQSSDTGGWASCATTSDIGNATLTIQKNSTTVDTFTANATSNKTIDITVPTDTSDLTNNAGYITSSGTAAKANQLTTARTIALGTGATGTATSFDGSSNITIPVTDVKDAYVTWGGKAVYNNITPDDAGCVDEFGHNKMAFLPAACIQVHYSTDGGSTWVDYGLTDAQKIQLVTYGDVNCKSGKDTAATSSNVTNLKLRVRIAAAASTATGTSSLYTMWKKILINVTDPNSDATMTLRYRTIANYKAGTETWVNSGTTYTVRGGSGWNSIPIPTGWPDRFGGNFTNQTSQPGQIEFVFSNTKLGTWGDKKVSASAFRMIGVTNWQMPSEMAKTGRLYTVDNNQNATFPKEIALSDLHALNVLPKSGDTTYRHLGRSGEEWKDVWLTDGIYANGNKLSLPSTAGTLALTSDLPTVNDATLTIQKNGSNVATFTANAASNATANIAVPTLSVTDVDPGTGSALAADTFLGVYDVVPSTIDGSRLDNGTVAINKLTTSAINSLGSYSTSEVATPFTWTDGKTIYKKTLKETFSSIPASGLSWNHGISNLSTVVKVEVTFNLGWDNTMWGDSGYLARAGLGTRVTSTQVCVDATAQSNWSGTLYFTIYYTKSS